MVPAIFYTYRDIFSAGALHPFKNAGLVVDFGIDALSDINLAVINLKNGQIGEKKNI